MKELKLTQAILVERFAYDLYTGVFYRLVDSRRRPNHKEPAGSLTKAGYMAIRVNGADYYAHRLAWLYVKGQWPEGHLDHINGNRADNRLPNLRAAGTTDNAQNRRNAPSGKRSGLALGVSFKKSKLRKPFTSRIVVNGSPVELGYFATEAEAHAAYVAAKRVLHDFCTI